jgi:hypothetical protein
MKNILNSKTVWGAVIALVSRFIGTTLDQDEGTMLAESGFAMWPLLLGIFADFKVIADRIRATNFDLKYFQSPVFRAAVFGFIMVVLQGMGVDWSGLETLPQKIEALIATGGSLAGFLMVLWGRATAKKQLQLP